MLVGAMTGFGGASSGATLGSEATRLSTPSIWLRPSGVRTAFPFPRKSRVAVVVSLEPPNSAAILLEAVAALLS